jgi:hypothetical protein
MIGGEIRIKGAHVNPPRHPKGSGPSRFWSRRVLTILPLILVSAGAAFIAARITFGADGWMWNEDLPKIDYPLALFFHKALEAGHLPLWEDHLGLGFPLYAEGQIGAFYPPNWLIFRLDPLLAFDVTRLLHLTIAGTGAGLVALRVAGSRHGALLAALIAVMGGAIVTKLEWWNLLAAYAWLPWVLLPLCGRRAPRRIEVAVAGALWGIQALAGHPNTWLLTGVAALILILSRPSWAALGRAAVFGLLGVAIGAMQLIPTALLRTYSVRAGGLSADDIFLNTSTPFDVVGMAFVNTFIRTSSRAWDYATSWFPDGHFPLLEASIYVGLPVLALVGLALPARRARRWLILAAVMAAIGVVAAFRPALWADIPILNGLRAPVRSYLVLSLAVAILAAIGVSRLGRTRLGRRWAIAFLTIPIVAYLSLMLAALYLPQLFEGLVAAASNDASAATLAKARELAIAALTTPWPAVAELALGAVALLVVVGPRTMPTLAVAVMIAVAPLALFMPLANPVRPLSDFSFADSPIVTTLQGLDAHRVLTIRPPGWYGGMPDQLAAADIPDIGMFSSLNLAPVEQITVALRRHDPDGSLRRALGIDVVVTFGSACPGHPVAHVAIDDAFVCRVDAPTRPPYWIPLSAVRRVTDAGASLPHADIDPGVAVATAISATVGDRSTTHDEMVVDAPAAGWIFYDRAWWPSWRITVDGRAVPIYEALGGQLVAIPAGRHRLVAELGLDEVRQGALIGVGGILGAAAWVAWPRFRQRRRPAARAA